MVGILDLNKRKILLFFGDILLLYFSLAGALLIGFGKNFEWKIFSSHLLPFTILYAVWLIVFYIIGLYDFDLIKTSFKVYSHIITALGFGLALGIMFFYLIPFFGITPKTNLVLNAVFFGIFSFYWRKLFYLLFSLHFQNQVAIIGTNPQAKELAEYIQKNPQLGYKFIAFFDSTKDVAKQVQKTKIDTLILAENLESNSALAESLYKCLPLKLNLMDLAAAYEIMIEKIPVSFVAQIWFLENLKEREKSFYEKIKRIIDIILALIILLLTLPLWPFIALATKLNDGGPIFYSHIRIGKDKKPFLLTKFRSMKPDAEKNGAVWADKEDPRITKIGKILRKTHIDEIPQMFNVLKGDISLVGPRPERPEFVEKLEKEVPHYHIRHLIKPGFTGWAQIKFRYGRSVMDSYEKFQYDLYYLKNRSLMIDIKVLLKTFNLFFKKE